MRLHVVPVNKLAGRRARFEYYMDSGGPWDNPLPRALRVAAEWNFGTWILVAILGVLREGLWPGSFMFVPAVLATVVTHTRGATSPAFWWFSVVGFTLFGAFLCFVVLVEW